MVTDVEFDAAQLDSLLRAVRTSDEPEDDLLVLLDFLEEYGLLGKHDRTLVDYLNWYPAHLVHDLKPRPSFLPSVWAGVVELFQATRVTPDGRWWHFRPAASSFASMLVWSVVQGYEPLIPGEVWAVGKIVPPWLGDAVVGRIGGCGLTLRWADSRLESLLQRVQS